MQNVDACATSESFNLDALVASKIVKTKAFKVMETKGILKVLSSSKQKNMLVILRTVFAVFASNGILTFIF